MAKSVITQYCVSVSRYGEVYSRRERPADQGHAWALIKAPTRRTPFCKYNAQIHFLQRNVSVLIERLLKFKFVINCISNPSNIDMSLSWKWITVPASLEPIPDFLFVSAPKFAHKIGLIQTEFTVNDHLYTIYIHHNYQHYQYEMSI